LVKLRQTFYKPPKLETILRWRRETPWRKTCYFRLNYSDEELIHLKGMAGDKAYLLFDNLALYNDALRFNSLVQINPL